MAKSRETFGKKDREKKRQQKRLDKEAKRIERKSHSLSGRPLQEMLVYVDENGNLSDSPPDQSQVKQNSRNPYGSTAGYNGRRFVPVSNNFRR